MKTRFGTVTLVPSHKHGFDAKQANNIERDISDTIDQYIPTQVPGDFLVDIDSFHIHPARFAILRFDDKWTDYANHHMIMKRLKERDGVIRLRLGDMLSAIIGGFHIRIWNYLDRSGNTLDINVSEVGVRVPFDVSDALNRAGLKRQEFEDMIKEKAADEIQTSKPLLFQIGVVAFSKKCDDWSPGQALTIVQDDDSVDVDSFDLNQVDLTPTPKTKRRQTPKAIRRTEKPSLKTGTNG